MRNMLALCAGALSLTFAAQAQAHAHLTASEPAANATVGAPAQLALHFSEKMVAKFSGFELAGAGGAKVPVKVHLDTDGKSLVGAPAKPLAPGAYTVTWHAVTTDTHRMEGSYDFTVR